MMGEAEPAGREVPGVDGADAPLTYTRLGVLGWPVAHSRSPAIQNAALAHVGLGEWRYQLLPVPPELFAETVPALPGSGFRGANVTVPHKGAALSLALASGGVVTERARTIGAANTLIFREGGRIDADNTDAPALQGALGELLTLEGASALVLGAGGTARAAVWSLLDAGVADVCVWNRTPERAAQLCADLGGNVVAEAVAADVLINTTTVGLDLSASDGFEGLPLAAGDLTRYRVVVDFVYQAGGTPLLRAARERLGEAATLDGLELLVRQGALSFEQFTGRPAPLAVMRAAVL
jgi:shikimate dehydrogenase